MTHWLFIPSTVSITGFLGEMLYTCFNWLASPTATKLEIKEVGAKLSKNTTTEAILITLIAARDKTHTIVGANDVKKLFYLWFRLNTFHVC
ncbi:hypothetical protein GQ457_15G022170 [Hibiscus cannabinus]